MTDLDVFQMAIKKYEMYSEDSTVVDEVLEQLVTLPIKYVCEFTLNHSDCKEF